MIYDWATSGDFRPQKTTTLYGCKTCLGIFVGPRYDAMDVVFVPSCADHRGFESEEKEDRDD